MDITLIGRNVGITDRFRSYATEKSDRVAHLAERALALEIRLCRHHETHGTAGDDRVEMTLIGPGPVIRAEAGGTDKYAAFDAALAKLMERIRRAKDRKKVHRGHGNRMTSLREASAEDFGTLGVVPVDGDELERVATGAVASVDEQAAEATEEDYNPVVIRRKLFAEAPMSIDDALYRMELVGHDFYLFVDSESGHASVVYRRKGWSYGLLEVGETADAASVAAEPAMAAG
jgi:ribosomal subunit interface protein